LHRFPIALNGEIVEQVIGSTREQKEHFGKSLAWKASVDNAFQHARWTI
jgi:hypothetical protein